jgi:hypothetical protein
MWKKLRGASSRTREVQDLKNSLQFSQGQLDELKKENAG